MKKEPSIEEILKALKSWSLEVKNPRNDGWVKKSYEDKIKKVFNEAGKLLRKK